MDSTDIDILSQQIRNIILNRPIPQNLKCEAAELSDLQESVLYLSTCVMQANAFLASLARGDLQTQAPPRQNYLASSLKELQSGLKHLTWQAEQVANGNYDQRVSFLGEFSDSFNKMISQLEERENKLKNQADAIKNSMDLMVAIMDGLKDWVLVTEEGSGQILYINQSARMQFFNPDTGFFTCGEDCSFMDSLRLYKDSDEELSMEFSCPKSGKTQFAKSFRIHWNGKKAFAHIIRDVTCDRDEKRQLESMAFVDVLTGLYNRRYCIQQLEILLANKIDFTVCLIDLDGLKYVNDTFGHIAGDEYLIDVAAEISHVGRITDTLCRIGGDEFFMIFPNADEQNIWKKMCQLSVKISSAERDYSPSISFGVLYVSSHDHLEANEIIHLADLRMYEQKHRKKAERRLCD